MDKLKLYFLNLIVCIIIFGLLQLTAIFAGIIMQIISICVLIYGILGINVWKLNKRGEENGNS